MPAGVKHFNKMDKSTNSSAASKGSASKEASASGRGGTDKRDNPPASVATEYFRKKEMERIQNKLNETSITDKDEEPGSSSDALSADHLDG